MNVGFFSCVGLIPIFGIMGLVFALGKAKAAILISGFNGLSKEERGRYDQTAMSKDMRNSCFLWMMIMLAGALVSYFVTTYAAVCAYVVWLVLFFRDVHMDAHKAFEKYLLR
ncbi:MAG: DUF3784 domain-containing protein [Lachnospira sp.]|nr:DUF3784 domain-containing protein [Lachnospira sp.]